MTTIMESGIAAAVAEVRVRAWPLVLHEALNPVTRFHVLLEPAVEIASRDDLDEFMRAFAAACKACWPDADGQFRHPDRLDMSGWRDRFARPAPDGSSCLGPAYHRQVVEGQREFARQAVADLERLEAQAREHGCEVPQ